jgi:putative SOS response-associated peptidase YedK
MCGRYALQGHPEKLAKHFKTANWPTFPDRFNIAPTSEVPIIRLSPEGKRVVHLLKWGLVPHWSKDSAIGIKLTNARAESVADKPSFQGAYKRRRCLIPATGYYEWQTVPSERKQPWFIHFKSGEPLAMGGIWESWTSTEGEILRTFSIITTQANEVMAPIHDRMPLIISPEQWSRWLSPDVVEVAQLLEPYRSDAMEAWPVTRKVSNAREEGAELIIPDYP